ncbi:MAG: hypothetical protein KC413_06140, partial [Anaerolineales bacterium]|nr:hypothetical protein [Anaerolineales bacterium]
MNDPIIGWEKTIPVPHQYYFNAYLNVRNGRLYFEDLDLPQLFLGDQADQGLGRTLPSPLEIIYLPVIRQRIAQMNRVFAEVRAEIGYNGRFLYTYASKANAAEEVIRTTLGAGAHHEMSSTVDVDIARLMIRRGLLSPDRFIVCNGFKPEGSSYTANIISLKQEHAQVIPVIEDLGEIAPFLTSRLPFDGGLRQKSYGRNTNETEMDGANSRFGLDLEQLWKAADYVAAAPNLSLKLYHYMVGSQLADEEAFLSYMKPGVELYARLRQRYPTLHIFDFGGGMPV